MPDPRGAGLCRVTGPGGGSILAFLAPGSSSVPAQGCILAVSPSVFSSPSPGIDPCLLPIGTRVTVSRAILLIQEKLLS